MRSTVYSLADASSSYWPVSTKPDVLFHYTNAPRGGILGIPIPEKVIPIIDNGSFAFGGTVGASARFVGVGLQWVRDATNSSMSHSPGVFCSYSTVMDRQAMAEASELARTAAHLFITTFEVNGYRLCPRRGVYPHVRMEKDDSDFRLASDFWISLDASGKYPLGWTRFAPFDLAGVASIDRVEQGRKVRYRQASLVYARRPYADALATLAEDSAKLVAALGAFTPESVLSNGERFVLP